jgi:hypothetical protein
MSELNFKCNFHSYELNTTDFPVEVRKSNMALVAQTNTSQSVQVEPGLYHVSARLPTGQELYNQIEIGGEANYTVDLYLDQDQESPYEHEEVQRFLVGIPTVSTKFNKGLEALGSMELRARIRSFTGSPLVGPLSPGPDPQGTPDSTIVGAAKFHLPRSSFFALVQLLQPGQPALNVMLPQTPPHDSEFTITIGLDNRLEVTVHLQNSTAEALLRYYERGMVLQMENLTGKNSPAVISEELLYGKVADPIAACVGAYTLLRLGELDRLHEWTENLKNWFDWLPDGLAIRAEHLARRGQHSQALENLLRLPDRGLPFFSDGLSFALNRLRTYLSYGGGGELAGDLDQAKQVLAALKSFAQYTDFSRPVLTFTGLEPHQPDDQACAVNLQEYGGVDLVPFLMQGES